MLKQLNKLAKKALALKGYEIRKMDKQVTENRYFQLYNYVAADGSFDYKKYKEVQVNGNKRKIEIVWAVEENIQFLSNYLKEHLSSIKFGLCHGTRRGKEQEWFRKYLGVEVIGTEISETASEFPHTIQRDFHETKEEWIQNVDFIYSNSFDHSYDQKKCLDSWMKCLKKGGVCIIEHTSSDVNASELDPFGADLSMMPFLVLNWSEGKYYVAEIISAPNLAVSPLIEIKKKTIEPSQRKEKFPLIK